ncbi:hypothetical protein RSX31_04610 [Rossellomorea sp. YC4-1]|jgi:hypothetical protein|nr:hypothetical protein [Rossellomorea sp. YC4-1]
MNILIVQDKNTIGQRRSDGWVKIRRGEGEFANCKKKKGKYLEKNRSYGIMHTGKYLNKGGT